MEAFIPNYKVKKTGLIRGVDVDISEEELLEELNSDVEILEVQRKTRKQTANGKVQFVPTKQ